MTLQIPRVIDTSGDRVSTIALTIFTTAAPRDRDHPLDVTLGDIPSYLHTDLPRIGRGGTTRQPVRRLLEVGRGDIIEQVIDLFAVHPLPVSTISFLSAQQCILTYFRRT